MDKARAYFDCPFCGSNRIHIEQVDTGIYHCICGSCSKEWVE